MVFLNDDIVKSDLEAKLIETLINLLEDMSFWSGMAVIFIGVVIGATAIEAVVKVKRMQIKHTERMAKIKQGIDPGDENEAYKKDEV